MNFSQTYSLNTSSKNFKSNLNCQNEIICQCNCCPCCCSCCSCCCCQCNCTCHIESRKQTEDNNNINQETFYENINYQKITPIKKNYRDSSLQIKSSISPDSMRRRIKNCQSYINIPTKYTNKKISDNVDNFNKHLISLKMKLNEQKLLRQNPSCSNTTNDNSPNSSALNFNNYYSPYINDNYYDNENDNNNNNFQRNHERSKQDFYDMLNSIKGSNKGELSPFKNKYNESNGVSDYNNEFNNTNPKRKKGNEYEKKLTKNKSYIGNTLISKTPINIRTTYAYNGKITKDNNNNNINNSIINRRNLDNTYNNNLRDFQNQLSYLNNTEINDYSKNNNLNSQGYYYQTTSYENKNPFQQERKYIPSNKINNNSSFVNLLKDKTNSKSIINQKNKINLNNSQTNLLSDTINKKYNDDFQKIRRNSDYNKSKLYIQNFKLNIIGENYQLDNSKDLLINELKNQILILKEKLNNNDNFYSPYINKENQNSPINRNNFIIQEQKEEIERLKEELKKENDEKNNLNSQLNDIQNNLIELRNENNGLHQLIENYDKNNQNNNYNENNILKTEISQYKDNLENLTNENKQLIENLNSLKNDLINLENENENMKQELLEKNKNEKLITPTKDNSIKEIEQLKQKLKETENKLNNLEEENEKLLEIQNQINLYKIENQRLKDSQNKLENENQKLIQAQSKLNKLEELNQKLIEAQNKLNILEDENKKLNKDISNYQSSQYLHNSTKNPEFETLQSQNKLLIQKISNYENIISNPKEKDYSTLNSSSQRKNRFKNLIVRNEEKLFYKGIPYTEEEYLKKITKTSSLTKKILTNSSSTTKIMTKFKIESDLSEIPIKNKIKVFGNVNELGDNLVFKMYKGTKNKNIICYDMKSKGFYFFDFADYNNFSSNFISDKNNGNVYLSYNSILYILTGKNYDMFYSFNPQKKSMEKLCSLNNNHSKGNLIPYHNSIICLSGEYNKKCEIYSTLKNEWNEMSEMKIERSEFGSCIIQDKYLFCIFGFNYPKNEYLNTIEYLDLLTENSNWEYLNYKNEKLLSLYIKGLLTVNYNDVKIILIGGYNGELDKPVEYFSQIILGEDFQNDSYVEDVNRKLKDIQKNKLYIFNSGITEKKDEKNRLYNIAYDNEDRIHVFEIQTMTHDVFNFE